VPTTLGSHAATLRLWRRDAARGRLERPAVSHEATPGPLEARSV